MRSAQKDYQRLELRLGAYMVGLTERAERYPETGSAHRNKNRMHHRKSYTATCASPRTMEEEMSRKPSSTLELDTTGTDQSEQAAPPPEITENGEVTVTDTLSTDISTDENTDENTDLAEDENAPATPEEQASVEQLGAVTAPKPDIPEADFTDFDAAVEAILAPHRAAEANGTTTSGEPDQALIPDLVAAYQALEGAKNKRVGRDRIKAISEASMNEDNFYTAKAAMLLDDHLVSAKAPKGSKRPPKTPVDPTSDYVDHMLVLNLAFQYAGRTQPESLAADWQDGYNSKLPDLTDELKNFLDAGGDTATLADDSLVAKAIKLGTQRKTKSGGTRSASVNPSGAAQKNYTGPPRSIVKHIQEAFANAESGTFLKINDIAKFQSDEYGEDRPSAGAISGQVKNAKFKRNFPDLEVAEMNGTKGVRKV